MFRKGAGVASVLVGVGLLTGCAGYGSGVTYSNSEETAYSADEAGFSEFAIALDDGSLVSCLEDGSGRSRVVSCVVVEETELPVIPVEDSGFTVEFVTLSNGDTVQCLEDGSGRYRVLSCVPIAPR